MSRLADTVGEYCASEHFFLLEGALKQQAESLLAYWCEQVGEDPSAEEVEGALQAVAHLDAPLEVRRGFPQLLQGFLQYVSISTPITEADEWGAVVVAAADGYLASFREDGTVRGQTVRRSGAEVGRNDPCPCGSGKKYKKCCMRG